MRNASIACLREIGVETGGSNVQFAVDPKDGRLVVIEMNPRVSRSSALASKATGFPIAKVAAKLAVGYTLDEIQNDITGVDPGELRADDRLCRHQDPALRLREVQGRRGGALDRDEVGRRGDGDRPHLPREPAKGAARAGDRADRARRRALALRRARATRSRRRWRVPSPDRLLVAAQALREGFSVAEIHAITRYDPWFLERIDEIVARRRRSAATACRGDAAGLRRLKAMGFSDRRLAELDAHARPMSPAAGVQGARRARPACSTTRSRRWSARPPRTRCARCATSSASARCSSGSTPAPPSSRRRRPICIRPTRRRASASRRTRASRPTARKVVILGGGPNRIGQGIEFDYCCVHACYALDEAGYRDDHGQLQSGDGLDRLRHLGPALFRAADRRGRARDPPRRAVERRRWSASSSSSAGRRR